MKARDYEVVEERLNINVNVLGYENRVFLLYASKKSNEQVLNVLLISNEEKSHYVFIKDFNRLMYFQIKTKNIHKKHLCMSCLQNFTTKEILNSHRERCLLINDTQAVKYETETITFKNFNKLIPVPFKIYADLECSLKRVNINKGGYKKLYQKHVPNSIAAKLVCIDDRFTLQTKIFTKDKVRDHCTGKYRGAPHKECNSKSRIPRKIPIIFHNLEGYDGHLIIRELNNFKDVDIQVIPKTDERYMSIIVNNSIVFLDCLQFLKASLDRFFNRKFNR